MTEAEIEKLKFPIGKFAKPIIITGTQIESWIKEIIIFPEALSNLSSRLSNDKKSWRYRPNGWTIKQLVHHCADSHINSFVRFKLSLTEESPIIRPYFESLWAELPDSKDDNLDDSLMLLSGLHKRWGILIKSLTDDELGKDFVNPETGAKYTLQEAIGLYAWHGNHHLAHIKLAINSEGKYN